MIFQVCDPVFVRVVPVLFVHVVVLVQVFEFVVVNVIGRNLISDVFE